MPSIGRSTGPVSRARRPMAPNPPTGPARTSTSPDSRFTTGCCTAGGCRGGPCKKRDRKRGGEGKRVELGGRRIIQKKKKTRSKSLNSYEKIHSGARMIGLTGLTSLSFCFFINVDRHCRSEFISVRLMYVVFVDGDE